MAINRDAIVDFLHDVWRGLVILLCVGMVCLTVYKLDERHSQDAWYRDCMWNKGDQSLCIKQHR